MARGKPTTVTVEYYGIVGKGATKDLVMSSKTEAKRFVDNVDATKKILKMANKKFNVGDVCFAYINDN